MAITIYRSKVRITTLALRTAAFEKLRDLLVHIEALNINFTSIVVEADKSVTVTLEDPLPAAQIDHLGLVAV